MTDEERAELAAFLHAVERTSREYAAEGEYERMSEVPALALIRRALAAEAEVVRLRAELEQLWGCAP